MCVTSTVERESRVEDSELKWDVAIYPKVPRGSCEFVGLYAALLDRCGGGGRFGT